MIGRLRSASEEPEIAVAISTIPLALKGSIAVICWMCLVVYGNWAWISCIGRTGTGTSFADADCHWKPICGSASASLVTSEMSCLVE